MEVNRGSCRYVLDSGSQCHKTPISGFVYCDEHAPWIESDLEAYRAITAHFRQDVREFWSRSQFYLVVQTGLLSVYAALSSPQAPFRLQTATLGLGIVGLVVAVFWFLCARGSVLWLRRWRKQVVEMDNAVDRCRTYGKVESFASGRPLMSPSNITQYLPLVFCRMGCLAFMVTVLPSVTPLESVQSGHRVYRRNDLIDSRGLPFDVASLACRFRADNQNARRTG